MKAVSKTDTGRVRTNNEDAIFIDPERGIFLLADGMGGHNAGEVASELAVKEVHSFLLNKLETTKDDAGILAVLEKAILKAHDRVKEKALTDLKLHGMGTTLVELVIKDNKAYVCHAGDSRAYLLRDNLKKITRDHTRGDYFVEQKIMSREKVPPQLWHTLTQAVGAGDAPVPDKKILDLKSGDILLLCSDGLTDMLTDDEIAAIFKSKRKNINKIADSLVLEANNRGGRDNISLILVKI